MTRTSLSLTSGVVLVLLAATWWGTSALYQYEIGQVVAQTRLPDGVRWQADSQSAQFWRQEASVQLMVDPARLLPGMANALTGWGQTWRWQVQETRWPLFIQGEAVPEPMMGTTRASPKDLPAPRLRWSVNVLTRHAELLLDWSGWQVGNNRLAPLSLTLSGNLHQLQARLASPEASHGEGNADQWQLQPFALSSAWQQDAPGVWRLAGGQLSSQGGFWQVSAQSSAVATAPATSATTATDAEKATAVTGPAALHWQPFTLALTRSLHTSAEQRSQLDWTLVAKAAGWQWQPAGAPSREVREVSGQLTLAGVDAIAADSLVNWLAQGAQPALQGILSAQLLARYGLRMQLDNLSLRYNGSQLGGRGRLQLQADPIPLLSVGQLRKRLQGEGQWQAEASLAAQPGFEWLAGALQQGTVQQMEKQLEAPWQIKRGKLTVNGQRVEGVLPF